MNSKAKKAFILRSDLRSSSFRTVNNTSAAWLEGLIYMVPGTGIEPVRESPPEGF